MNILQLIFSFLVPTALGKIPDWLIKKIDYPAEILENTEDSTLTLTNGLVSRTFLYSPGFATIDLYSHEKNSSVLRAIDVEVLFFFLSCTKIILRIQSKVLKKLYIIRSFNYAKCILYLRLCSTFTSFTQWMHRSMR